MKVIDPGHCYLLHCLDTSAYATRPLADTLQFVKRVGDKYPGNITAYSGTQLQECWRAEIDRLQYLHHQQPCAETETCIHLLRTCLYLLEQRAARLHGIELPFPMEGIEHRPICISCGHVICHHFPEIHAHAE